MNSIYVAEVSYVLCNTASISVHVNFKRNWCLITYDETGAFGLKLLSYNIVGCLTCF